MDDKKTIISWALYDWANSAFATTVMAGFFPVFFKQFWNSGAEGNVSTIRLGLGNSTAGIIVAVLAPILGAIADRGTAKKRFLMFFALMGVIMTVALSMIQQGHWLLALGVYVVATIGFSGGNIFYDALITGVASSKKLDMVSAFGYALGYLGGSLLFTVNVWMVQQPQVFGLADKTAAIRWSFLTVGLWWAVFSIPVFLFVKEPANPKGVTGRAMIRAGFDQLGGTFREIRNTRVVFLFLIAYWFYIDGVDTIIRMAVDYGINIGLPESGLIKALLITNFVGFPAALAFGWIGKTLGARQGIFITIGIYMGVTLWATFMRSTWEFYMLAVTIGLVQGGIQALSRSYYARLIPVDKSAEFFGFYNMLGKFAVVIGPMLISAVVFIANHMGATPDMASRLSIGSVSILFAIGAVLLYFVRPESMPMSSEDEPC
jgi:MFS transporter, UMF1 family